MTVPTWAWWVVGGFAALFALARHHGEGGVFGSAVGASVGPVGASAGLVGRFGYGEPGDSGGGGESALFPARNELPSTLIDPGGDAGNASRSYQGGGTQAPSSGSSDTTPVQSGQVAKGGTTLVGGGGGGGGTITLPTKPVIHK